MEKFYVYILYSKTLNKYYVGATRLNPRERQARHLISYYGQLKYTTKASDWELFYEIECLSFSQALKIEKHIKRMKSKLYIKNLSIYPEMAEKLLKRYS